MEELELFLRQYFGVPTEVFLQALRSNPSANGYILGAISEVLLKVHLEQLGYDVLRIKEKPAGGNKAKNIEARGDFYIRKKGTEADEWLVIESKGLKSNSEFRGSKLDSKTKLYKFLKKLAFPKNDSNQKLYDKGYSSYVGKKADWEAKNPGKSFPLFTWKVETAGANSVSLTGIWKDEKELKEWVEQLDAELFTEQAYRSRQGAIVILETHQPSTRVGTITKISQTAPLVADFNIMAVDLFLRTGRHEFVFMNPEHISHSPTSPEHLYQNYTIDILVKDKKVEPVIRPPWYWNIEELINETNPTPRLLDATQLDSRHGFEILPEEDFVEDIVADLDDYTDV
jgi:hypothetical protein